MHGQDTTALPRWPLTPVLLKLPWQKRWRKVPSAWCGGKEHRGRAAGVGTPPTLKKEKDSAPGTAAGEGEHVQPPSSLTLPVLVGAPQAGWGHDGGGWG